MIRIWKIILLINVVVSFLKRTLSTTYKKYCATPIYLTETLNPHFFLRFTKKFQNVNAIQRPSALW